MYRIFPNRLDNFLDAFGITWLRPWKRVKLTKFWALRDINLELKKGSSFGIIGRTGAGKSTLLKLITGNVTPTEGKISVNGQIQALLDMGAGFHPEFTGFENIRVSLTYQGFTREEIEEAIKDIAEFTELGQFLEQQFKTYSSGMQARLTFATATAVKPDILIVDEILGAGDAYFAGKSNERMKQLVKESGASVLLVSHSMESVVRYCDECLWIERGRIVMRGSSMEVVKAYDEFIHKLEDRRLKARNRKRQFVDYDPSKVDHFADTLVLTFQLQGDPGARCEINEITILKEGQDEETLKVGDVQDTNWAQMSWVSMDGSQWSEPLKMDGHFCRSLIIKPGLTSYIANGHIVFYLWAVFENVDYAFKVRYRCTETARLCMVISHNGKVVQDYVDLPNSPINWLEWTLHFKIPLGKDHMDENISSPEINSEVQTSKEISPSVRRWPSEGSITIEKVRLLGPNGQEQAVFSKGMPLSLKLTCLAHRSGTFPVIFATVLFRIDGIVISQNISDLIILNLMKGESREVSLNFAPLNLGNGRYLFSASLHKKLDPYLLEEAERYDLIDRSYEFEVVGNPPLRTAIYHLDAEWMI